MSRICPINRRILVIDDNPSIHEDYRKVLGGGETDDVMDELALEIFGDSASPSPTPKAVYSLDSALQGKQGYEMVKQAIAVGDPYAMAFVDMRMPPGWDGLETILHLWEADPRLNVVLCTAYSDYAWSDVVDKLGTNDRWLILKKPFDNAEVCQLAAALVEKRRLTENLLDRMDALESEVAIRTAEVREREERLRAILDTAPDGIVTFSEQGTIESFNTAAAKLTGMNADEALGQSIATLWEASSGSIDATLTRMLNLQRGESISMDLQLKRVDGSLLPSNWTIGEFNHSSNRSLTAIIRDESERERMRRELNQSQKLEAVGQLAAGIAHEINTPTQFVGDNIRFLEDSFSEIQSVLRPLADLLASCEQSRFDSERTASVRQLVDATELEYLTREIPVAIEQSLDGVERISKIVQAVKEFSHPGTHEKVPTDIHKSLEAAVTVSHNAWKYVADVKTHFDPQLPLVPVLLAELNQVFINILVNAAHAIVEVTEKQPDQKGTIEIRTRKLADYAEISFRDTGTGIPEAARNRVFDPFFTTKEVGKGTGQGLAISHSIVVDKHQGKIELESEVGVGTTIRLLLPLEVDVRSKESGLSHTNLLSTASIGSLTPHHYPQVSM